VAGASALGLLEAAAPRLGLPLSALGVALCLSAGCAVLIVKPDARRGRHNSRARRSRAILAAILLALSGAAFVLPFFGLGLDSAVARAALLGFTAHLALGAFAPSRPLRERGSLARLSEIVRPAALADGGERPLETELEAVRAAFGFTSVSIFESATQSGGSSGGSGGGSELVLRATAGGGAAGPVPECVRAARRTGRATWATRPPLSEMACPIVLDGRIAGILHLASEADEPFSADDVAISDAISLELAARLRARRRAETERERTRALELSGEIARRAAGERPAADLVPALADLVRGAGRSGRRVAILLREGNALVVRGASGDGPGGPPPGTAVGLSSGVAGAAIALRRAVTDADADGAAGRAEPDGRRARLWPESRSAMAAPIVVDGSPIGAVVIEREGEPLTPPEDELGLLALAADWVAAAVAIGLRAGAERALSAERADRGRLAEILDSVPDAVVVADSGLRVTYMNAHAETLLGRRLDEEKGPLSLDELAPGVDFRERIEEARKDERRVASADFSPHPKDGGDPDGEVHYQVTVTGPREGTGAVCAVFRDVSREREIEKVKTDFLANVCHELRTPLTAIVGFAELFHDEDLGALNSEQKECTGRIVTQAQHLLGIINNLLDLSRLDAGHVVLELESVPVDDVVREAAVNLSTLFDAKHIECRVDLPEEPLPPVHADRQKLNQVLFNLVNNAIKFTPAGGTVTLSARAEGDFVHVAVADTGIGIPEEKLPNLFQRFFRANERRARGTPGTGLGLAIVKEIVELVGGTVRCESEVGRGSRFTFSLPKASAAPPADGRRADAPEPVPAPATPLPGTPKPLPAAEPGRRPRILIVDDRPEVRLLVSVKLRKRFDILSAENGLQAIELARAERPDLVLMDMMMPVMDGIAATRTLKSDPDTKDMEIWAFTARALDDELEKAREAGCTEVVTKPFDPAVLFERVCAHFDSKALGAPARTAPRAHPGQRHLRRPLVLLVDDDAEAHRLVGHALWSEGFDLASVDRGKEALVLAKKCRPAAILLDIKLPDVDGFEILERLKADPETAAIPVFVFSVVADPKRGFALGAVDYLQKPFGAERLVQSLKHHLGRAEPETVLIVDDDEDFVALLKSFLRGERIEILQAFSVREALEVVETRQPDVVIMDVVMGGTDGFGFVDRLKHANRQMPSLVVTALDLGPDEREKLKLGLTRYVNKRHLSRREFREEVRHLLRSLRPE